MFDPAIDESQLGSFARLANPKDLSASPEDRGRSYLDANCAHCHRPGGAPANFDARFDTPVSKQNIIDGNLNSTLGIDGAKVIVRGSKPRSMIHYRVDLTGPRQMPPLARNTIDNDGLNAIDAWIDSLASAPINLTAAAFSDSTVGLNWTGTGENDNVFSIERSLNGVDWSPALSVNAPLTTAQDTGLLPATTYFYRVRAIVQGGDSAVSNVASTTTSVRIDDGGNGAPPLKMSVTSLVAKLNFAAAKHDSIAVAGVIPGLPQVFSPDGASVTLEIGGVSTDFRLDVRGRGRLNNGSFALTLKAAKGKSVAKSAMFLGGNVKFKFSLQHGDWTAGLGIDPAKTAKNLPLTLKVDLTYNGQAYSATVPARYSGAARKSGVVKSVPAKK
jgi:mono/diheme cytochrome c family protein